MTGIVSHAASAFAGALWSTSRDLVDAFIHPQEPLARRTVDQSQDLKTHSVNNRTLHSTQNRRRPIHAENSHDFRASSKPVPIKSKAHHSASPDNRFISSSHIHPPLDADHFQDLERLHSTPTSAAPSTQRQHKLIGLKNMASSSQRSSINLTHITGNQIISACENQCLTPRSTPRVRFADTKDMQSVTGGRHVGRVTDNESRASNKMLMKGRRVVKGVSIV